MLRTSRLLIISFVLFVILGMFLAMPSTVSAVPIQQTAVAWVKAQADGEVGYDVDGLYGYQCSDFATAYINYLIDGNAWSGGYTTYNGYQYYDISYPSGWQKIANYDAFVPQPGDILVFNGTNLNPLGHVNIAIEGCTTTSYNAVGQNGATNWRGAHYQSGSYFDSYNSFRGVIRPPFGTSSTTSTIALGAISNLSNTDATISASITPTSYVTTCGAYIGTSVDAFSKISEVVNGNVNSMWYNLAADWHALSPGRTYYYKFFAVIGGVEVQSAISSFTTTGDTTLPTGSWVNPLTNTSYVKTGTLQLSVQASDNIHMAKVTFHALYDGVWHDIGADTHGGNGTYTLSWAYNINPQDVLIHAHLYDDSGNYKNISGPTIKIVNYPGTPTLSANVLIAESNNVTFTWGATSGTTGYDLRILQNGSVIKSIYSIKTTTYTTTLAPGIYTAYLCSVNENAADCWTKGNTIGFTIQSVPMLTVSFDSQGGSTVAAKSAKYNTTITAPTAPTLSGYVFVGWYTSTNFTTPWIFSSTPVTANITLYARWLKSPVGSLAVSSAGYNSIKLTWASSSGANGYKIYRSISSTGTYSWVTTITSGLTSSFMDTGLTTNTTYYYKAVAYATIGTSKVYSAYSSAVSAKPIPSVPANFTVGSAGYNSNKLIWTAVSGANGYVIYRAESSTGPYVYKNVSKTTSYLDTGLKTGKLYYYKVRSYSLVDGIKIFGRFTGARYAIPVPAVPTNFAAVRYNATSVKLSWTAPEGGNGVQVFRATSLYGPYTAVGSTTSSWVYLNTGLTTGTRYYYKIRAFTMVDGRRVYGKFTGAKYATP